MGSRFHFSLHLKMEGKMESRTHEAAVKGERAAVVRHQDNLKMEGKMESRTHQAVSKGERAVVKRQTDNLKMEGSMEGLVSTAQSASKAIQKVNFNSGKAAAKARNAASSIVVGDDMASTAKAIEQHVAKRQSSATMATATSTAKASMTSAMSATSLSASSTKAAATSKQTKSSGVASTVVQSDGQEAAIQAVNTEKFASSLRESAGVQIGVQKDLSVIDAHRRQSMQQQQSHGHQGSHHHTQTNSGNFFGGQQAAESSRNWSNSAHAESRQMAAQQQP